MRITPSKAVYAEEQLILLAFVRSIERKTVWTYERMNEHNTTCNTGRGRRRKMSQLKHRII